MTVFKVLLISLLALIFMEANCQEEVADSIMLKDEVVINAPRLEEYSIGVSVQQLSYPKTTIYKSQDVSTLLSNESGVTIKAYGAGGLSTASIRGGGGNHTPVLWNGINLQNSMNGNASLSLIPVAFFDEVYVQYGGGSTLFGSGLISGAIHIQNTSLSQKNDHINIGLGMGSFGDRIASGHFKKSLGKLHSELRYFYREIKNDFEYINISKFRHPTEKLTNAGLKTFGIIQNNEIKIRQNSKITSSIWYSHYDKDLQSLMIQDTSKANQTDNSFRVNLTYQHSNNNNPLRIKSAFLYDELIYNNPVLLNPTSHHYTYSLVNEAEKRILINSRQHLNLGINYTFEQAISDGISDVVNRNRIALFGNYRLNNILPNFHTSLNIRQEIVDAELIPTVLSAGFDYLVFPFLLVKGNASKNYRIPTFNDLYWRTDTYSSGNPNLLPESGYNVDFGIKEYIKRENFSATFEQDFYRTNTKNRIVWLPDENGRWKPENKDSGKSYGAEISYKTDLDLSKYKLFSDGFFKYSVSTLADRNSPDTKRSVWYEPRFSFRGTIGIEYNRATLSYNHSYFSERQYDNQNTLDPYHLGSVFLAYQYQINQNILNLSLNINNVWNAYYQVVAWYAMPPTNYQLNISYQLNL